MSEYAKSDTYNKDSAADVALKQAHEFLNSGSGVSLEEIKTKRLLQVAIGTTMPKYWRKRVPQENFIKMFIKLPEHVSLSILNFAHEMFMTTELLKLSDKEKKDWCDKVVSYLGRVDKSKTDDDLHKFSTKIMDIFNKKILYHDVDDFFDEDDDEPSYDNPQPFEDEKINDDEDVSDFPTTRDILKPVKPVKETTSQVIDNNPNSIASNLLAGIPLKDTAIIEKIKIHRKFATACYSALSMQVVVGEAKNKENIRENFLKSLGLFNDEFYEAALKEFVKLRKEMISSWRQEDQRAWYKALKDSDLNDKRKRVFLEIINWPKPKAELKPEAPKNSQIKQPQKQETHQNDVLSSLMNTIAIRADGSTTTLGAYHKENSQAENEFYDDMKYFFETGSYKDSYFDRDLTPEDNRMMAKALSDVFIEYRDDNDKIDLYSKAVAYMELDVFVSAIKQLVKNYKAKKIEFTRDKKKEITLKILYQLKDFGVSDFKEYREKLIYTISGYAETKPTLSSTTTTEIDDEDDDE
ncbi:hypothetical protein [Serratia sp. Se-RSBMAAmG]|uniref:hypothetical protein n=1 Tax=Serratia sp. Se-RSBMAAmG TaxID=3043305 RepID=UPI0024AF441E|nr:hypothetical protein [Serratia sp. Se-RSBMAAmG]MDI6977691.1 hypothetical protein [Serratia sp. Se-RSBMAAmG]